jgi:hypothetical protein
MFIRNGFVFSLVNLLLGFCLTIASVLYQHGPDPACQGGLGAGFPLSFICDDTGGSPISSWGRFDLADLSGVNPRVFLLDLLLLDALVSVIWVIVAGMFDRGLSQVDIYRWALLFCAVNILAFLFAFLSFQSGKLDFSVPFPRTPTPFIPSPTPNGTPPPLPPVAPT